jgi:hypothetical protein
MTCISKRVKKTNKLYMSKSHSIRETKAFWLFAGFWTIVICGVFFFFSFLSSRGMFAASVICVQASAGSFIPVLCRGPLNLWTHVNYNLHIFGAEWILISEYILNWWISIVLHDLEEMKPDT